MEKISNISKSGEVLRNIFIKKMLPQLEDLKNGPFPKNMTFDADNLFEMRILLEIFGFSKKDIEVTLAHENAHANKASSFEHKGVKNLGYRISVHVKENGECICTPQARNAFPDEFRALNKEHREIITAVFNAPAEYGDKLSPDDVDFINSLK